MSKDDYNWIDDPFDDRKNVKFGDAGNSRGTKMAFFALGMVLLAGAIITVLVLVFLSVFGGELYQ